MLTRRLARRTLALATVLTIAVAAPAHAGDGTGNVDCQQDPTNPACTIEVHTPGAPGSPGDAGSSACHDPSGRVVPCYVDGYGWLADDGCYYQPAVEVPSPEVPSPTGHWYRGTCGYPPVGEVTKFRFFENPPGPALLAAEAVKALHLPAPRIRVNPAPPAAQLVFLPTWMWLDAASWGTRSATASVPGMSVTATATPSRLVMSTGDGASVTCRGAGTAWKPGMNPNTASPTCGHTFARPGSFGVTATVTWDVSWAGGGATGTVPPLTTTATLTVRVVESQALNGDQSR